MLESLSAGATTSLPRSQNKPNDAATTGNAGAFNAAITDAKSTIPPQTGKSTPSPLSGSNANIRKLVNGLNGDGDEFTVSMQAGGRVGVPLEELGIPGGIAGPQAQYGYDVTVKQVGSGSNTQYQVTFDKDLMAGANGELDSPGEEADSPAESNAVGVVFGSEINLISSGTVTMTFSSKQELTRGLNALGEEAQAQTLRDAGSLANPQVAIAMPTVPRRDAAALGHDGSNLVSDSKNTATDGLKVASDLLPGRDGHLISDLGAFGHSLFHSVDDSAKTASDVARTAWDTAPAETASTVYDNATHLTNFVSNPLDQRPGGSALDVPLGGPSGQFVAGALDSAAAKTGPSAADLKFLKSHITGYSLTIGEQDRERVDVELGGNDNIGPVKVIAKLIGEPRLANNTQITIAETLPQDGEPGTVSITFADKLNLDARGVFELKASLAAEGLANKIADPNIGSVTGSVTLTWNLSAEQSKKLADAGHSLPVTDLISGSKLARPDQLTAKIDAQLAMPIVRQNGKWVPSGSFSHETLADFSVSTTYNDPQVALKVLRNARGNPFPALPTLLSSRSHQDHRELDLYDQHGLPIQQELGGRINGVAEAKVWLYQQATTEHRIQSVVYPSPAQQTPPVQPKSPVQPKPPVPCQPEQLVVLPYEGLNVRAGPDVHAAKLGAFSSGTFVQTTGRTALDPQGHEWVQVTGPDSDRQTVTGWVAAQYVTPHAQGGENATGRIDQTLRGQGYIAVTVQPGDTIDGIAARYGIDPTQAIAVNDGHIIDPNLIFPGDTVYLPNDSTANRSPALRSN
jgi:hypothetical protein